MNFFIFFLLAELRYVAHGSEWKELRKARGEDKVKQFKEFWLRHDVTKDTPDNELFNEYYHRIQIANEKYGAGVVEGWKTDRGHVYI